MPFPSGTNQARSGRHEKRIAREFGGRSTRASGAKLDKADTVTSVARLEEKTTTAKSFSVTLDMVQKIQRHSADRGEIPAILIEFTDGSRTLAEVAVIPKYALLHMLQLIAERTET